MKMCLGCFERIKNDAAVCPYCGFKEGSPPEEAVHMEPGTLLADRYIIGRVMGYGGFGVTYIAWDKRLEKKVAIKEYMPSEFSTRMPGQTKITIFNGTKNEQFNDGLNKFVDEAKRLSKFQTESGIVKIFDCIGENGTAYIIMEYLDGELLSDRIKREGKIPEAEAIRIMMPLMKSLEVVHGAGIIHRDIAPDNIFLTKDGEVKLIDFGAARFATTSHSRSLTVIIKPGYSAEEQYRSRGDQGPHTDVYSVAATLYKMITGETPPDALERRAKIETLRKDILTEPHRITKDISMVTENAILNALNIRIEDRTPTVRRLMADLTSEEPVKRVYGKIKKIDYYRMPMWIKILVPSLAVVLMVFGVMLASGIINFSSVFKSDVEVPAGYTIVPAIEGLDVENAENQLAVSNLTYVTGGSVISDFVPANMIVLQNPEAGRIVPVNSVVEITISRGTGIVEVAVDGISTVPVFLWSDEEVAVRDFETAGLIVTIEYVYDPNVTAGQVIRATDAEDNELNAGDSLPEGSSVILYVSRGPENRDDTGAVIETEPVDGNVEVTPTVTPVPTSAAPTTAESEDSSGQSGSASATNTPTPTSTPTPTPTSTPTPTPTSTPTPVPMVTVSFDSNGGSYIAPIEIPQGSSLGTLPVPSMDYYRFTGWQYDGSSVEAATVADTDMLLTAGWRWSEEWTDWSDWSDDPIEPIDYPTGPSTYIGIREVQTECVSPGEGHYEYHYTYTFVTITDAYTRETTSLTRFDYVDGWYVDPDGGQWMTENVEYVEIVPAVYRYRYRDRIP